MVPVLIDLESGVGASDLCASSSSSSVSIMGANLDVAGEDGGDSDEPARSTGPFPPDIFVVVSKWHGTCLEGGSF